MLVPRPDYWAALLWRRLMGTRVLAFESPPERPTIRAYAHCTRGGARGAVTLLVLNLSRDQRVRLRLPRVSARRPAQVYLVTAADGDGTEVNLNGAHLVVDADGNPPAFVPIRHRRGTLTLPPVSYAFVVVKGARAKACTGS